MPTQNLEEKFASCDVVSYKDINALSLTCDYGSMGLLNRAVDCLALIRGRIDAGQKIEYEGEASGRVELTDRSFKSLVKDKFPVYIVRELYKKKAPDTDVYFSLKNTDEGFDLVYTGTEEQKLTKWIANISEVYALVYLRVNGVVYIQHRRSGSLTPMLSEHNNHYVYDTVDCKIKEIM